MISKLFTQATALILLVSAMPAAATRYNATAATLDTIFKQAAGGDTIVLSGDFGATYLSSIHAGKGAINIDARNAVFTNTLKITGVNGLRITGGKYSTPASGTSSPRAIYVVGGSQIYVTGATFSGSKDNRGIEFVDTISPSVWSSSFTNLWVGAAFTRVSNGTLAKNTVVGSVSDGFVVSDSHSVSVNRNSCSSGTPFLGAHPDCVQLWSVAGHAVQSDVTLSSNSATGNTQGFTSFDPAAGGLLRGKFINNRVDTSQPQGIACYNCVDSVFTGNVVTTLLGSAHTTNINIIGGHDNLIANNSIGPRVPAPNSGRMAFAFAAPLAQTDAMLSAPVAQVPEPGTWAMLIAGFGFIGTALRRRISGAASA